MEVLMFLVVPLALNMLAVVQEMATMLMERAFPPVSVAFVRPFRVIVDEPRIQIFLKRFHAFIEVFPEGNPEELVQHSHQFTLSLDVRQDH